MYRVICKYKHFKAQLSKLSRQLQKYVSNPAYINSICTSRVQSTEYRVRVGVMQPDYTEYLHVLYSTLNTTAGRKPLSSFGQKHAHYSRLSFGHLDLISMFLNPTPIKAIKSTEGYQTTRLYLMAQPDSLVAGASKFQTTYIPELLLQVRE